MLTLTWGLDKQREGEEGEEGNSKLLKAGADAVEPFKSAEKPLDLSALPVKRTVELPRSKQVRLRQEQRDCDAGLNAELELQAPSQDESYQ